MTVTEYRFEPGAAFPDHQHPEEMCVVVLAGELSFAIAGDHAILGPGDVCVVPPDTPHGAVAGHVGATFVSVVTPRRGDVDTITYLE